MNLASIILLVTSVICAIGYMVSSRKKDNVFRDSVVSVKPILEQTQDNQGERRNEDDYVRNGAAIANDGVFKSLTARLSEQFRLNLEQGNNEN